MRRTVLDAAVAAGALFGLVAPPAVAGQDGPGPELSVPADKLEQRVDCTGLAGATDRHPILLIHGTFLGPEVNFSWNYEQAFVADGRPYCTVELPGSALADIQVSAEYVVHAIREIARRSGEDVDIVGYSQGGMIGRWALKFWPGTRELLDDLIALDPSNYGTLDAVPLCLVPCAPAVHQQQVRSNFLTTLNAGPDTYAGIDYTVIYTLTDEVVFPNVGPAALSQLRDGAGEIANIPVQQVCPVHVAEHVSMGTTDPVGYALVIDALEHDGTADPNRIDRSVCTKVFMPAVEPATVPQHYAELGATVAEAVATAPRTLHEPPLRPYAR